MVRPSNVFTAAFVKNAKSGRYGDGGGLYLLVRPTGARFWLFRYKPTGGKMREMGLGPASGQDAVSLADARAKATDLRLMLRSGKDPLEERAKDAAEAAAQAQAAAIRQRTFKEVANALMDAKEAGWRNDKHRKQWRRTLDQFAFPVFGDMPVSEIGTDHIMDVLQPIWQRIPETASRLRGRIEAVLDFAKARKWREGENPAQWRGHLSHLLPAVSKVARVEHHAALPWAEMGAFMKELRQREATSARALEFAILTAARTGEVLGARWCEIDLGKRVWTVPGDRMKAGREHRVPLTSAAVAVLEAMAAVRPKEDPNGEAFVFPGAKKGSPLSQMAMLILLRRMDRADITAHGFRSTFRDWVAESTAFAGEIAEAALAHVVGDKVEAAYRRGDLFDKRRKLMEAWADYCAMPTHVVCVVALPMKRKRA